MTKIRKTSPADFSKIVPLLEEFDNENINRRDWERIFAYDWSKDQSIVGFHLEDHPCLGERDRVLFPESLLLQDRPIGHVQLDASR